MGNRFNIFIQNLSDHELAIYVGYQSDSLLDYSREIVKNEINSRQLTKKQLDDYLNNKLTHNEDELYCQQCGSNNIIQDKDIEHTGGTHISIDIEITTNRCRICNFNPSKSPEKNILKRIQLFFTGDSNKSERTIKTYDWFGN